MMPLSSTLIAQLTSAGIAGLWQGAALALMAAALLRLTPRASASLRHTLLVAVFALAALLPWMHFATPANSHAVRIAPWFAATLAALWLAASAVRATGLALAWTRLRAVRRNATPITLEGTASFTAGTRRAVLCTSPDVDSPTILGFRQPRLLLPTWMTPLLTADDLQQIALHECEHLRRNDDWLNLLLQVGLVVSPLNPALVWLDRRIALQRELACDAAVVRSTAQPIAYATCLTRLAEQRMHHTRLALALAAWGKQSELVQRVHALLARPAQWTKTQSRAATCATAAVLLAGATGLAHTPLAIRIAAAPQAIVAAAAPAGDIVLRDRMPANLHVALTSYTVKPTSTPTHKATHKPAIHHLTAAAQPHFLRTATLDTDHPTFTTAQYQVDPAAPQPRIVTTEFLLPYVAVPVANGWLIFQL